MKDMLKCKIGVLLIATSRFRNLGSETPEGSYGERKQIEAQDYINSINTYSEVVYTGPVYDRQDLEKAMNAFGAEKVDCVFALFLSWAEDFAWIRFLRDMYPVPVIFACRAYDHIKFNNTNAETDFVEFLSSGGLVGALEASGSVKRFNRPMMISVIGTFDEIVEKTRNFAQAAAVRTCLLNSSFGLLPSYNEVMWSTYIDPYNLFMKAGPELRFISVSTLVKEIENTDYKKVKEVCGILSSKYKMLPDVDLTKFEASVRASLAMEAVSRKAGINLMVLNDINPVLLTELGLRPGFLPCPGTNDITVVPEGDIGGGLAVYILKMLSEKPVNFIEPFYIDLEHNYFAAGHAGPNDYTDPKGNMLIARDVRFAKTSYKYAGAPFAWYVISPGVKTMLHISECNNQFKMVCTLVEGLPAEHFITSYSHGKFRPLNGNIKDLFDKLLQIGVTQHYALVEGNYINQLVYLAKLMNFELEII